MSRPNAVRMVDVVLVGFLGFLWGIPYALTKLSLASIPPITLTAGRVAVAAAVLWALVGALGRQIPKDPLVVKRLFVQGMITCVLPYTLIAFGQRFVDSALAAILNSSTPLFVCLVGACWSRHEPISVIRFIGAAFGIGGVVLVVGASTAALTDSGILGELAIVAATACSAISVIYGRRFAPLPSDVVAAGMLSCAAIVLLPLALIVEHPWTATPTFQSVAAMLVNAVGTTALGFVVYFRLIRTAGSLATSTTSFLKPLVGVSIGIMLDEAVTLSMGIGLLAILLALAFINGFIPDSVWARCRRLYGKATALAVWSVERPSS